ncbi:hypothetical protein AGLY_005164 [Aphis glycines]|uniref:Uncharacterized protein n=1 Tax=Aphis glycines TaxID=307491 RepID=A0A6G0TW04_APHGL|nr:hypothetical protein AGLY_005164 [Aphis glycines]
MLIYSSSSSSARSQHVAIIIIIIIIIIVVIRYFHQCDGLEGGARPCHSYRYYYNYYCYYCFVIVIITIIIVIIVIVIVIIIFFIFIIECSNNTVARLVYNYTKKEWPLFRPLEAAYCLPYARAKIIPHNTVRELMNIKITNLKNARSSETFQYFTIFFPPVSVRVTREKLRDDYGSTNTQKYLLKYHYR